MNLYSYHYKSPISVFEIIYDENYIYKIKFIKNNEVSYNTNMHKNEVLNKAINQLENYFNGKLFDFDLPLAIKGTQFQIECWKQMSNIKYGKTKTYKEIAELINNPNSMRAVGMAANRNAFSIIIPCHRVIGSNGKLVGYAGELWRKEWLLNFEKENCY